MANRAADILSRTGPLPGEWCLHTEVIAQISAQYGTAQVEIFAYRETTYCLGWYSITVQEGRLDLDALSQEWLLIILILYPHSCDFPQGSGRVIAQFC